MSFLSGETGLDCQCLVAFCSFFFFLALLFTLSFFLYDFLIFF